MLLLLLFLLFPVGQSIHQFEGRDQQGDHDTFVTEFNALMARSTGLFHCRRVFDSKVEAHKVCYDPHGTTGMQVYHGTGRKFSVIATIKKKHLDTGTDVRDSTNDWTKARRKQCGCDEAGHIIAKRLGGLGHSSNVFPQNGQLNRGLWRNKEQMIYDFLDSEEKIRGTRKVKERHVVVRVAFKYEDTANPNRPSEFHYFFEFFEQNQVDHVVMGRFKNEDQQEIDELDEFYGHDQGFTRRYRRFLPPDQATYPYQHCYNPNPLLNHVSKFGNLTQSHLIKMSDSTNGAKIHEMKKNLKTESLKCSASVPCVNGFLDLEMLVK